MELRRIHPPGSPVTPAAALTDVDFGAPAPPGRPYVVANMVASADGRASLDGRSGGLGGATDRAVFHQLRARVDAVMAGTGTLRAERYGRLIKTEELREQRAGAGLAPDALAVVVSRSLDLPLGIGLFTDPAQPVVVLTGAARPLEGAGPNVTVERLAAEEDTLAGALARLRERHGVRSLLCEGGPTVLGALLAERLVDELFLTLSPLLVGGGGAPAIIGADRPAAPAGLELVWVLEAEGSLFMRYRVTRD